MTDRPIIFSALMVLALLSGQKTQTRRLAWRETTTDRSTSKTYGLKPTTWQRVQPGDRLWVREAWGINDYRHIDAIPKQRPGDLEPDALIYFATESDCEIIQEMPRRPSIHMPRWASRLTLTVTDVRLERLQEITEADARTEGVMPAAECPTMTALARAVAPDADFCPHKSAFASLWDNLHGAGSWASNPEVVRIAFTVEQRNIDHA